jgi:hypothetical protein
MNTSVEGNERAEEPAGTESCCSPACACNARGLSTKVKTGVCLLVALAALAVVSLGSAKRAGTDNKTGAFAAVPVVASPTAVPATDQATAATGEKPEQAPATASPTAVPLTNKPAATPARKQDQAAVWGPTLSSLASLNKVAADKDAVFVFLPAKDGERTGEIRAQVAAAAKKARARGSRITAYTLSSDAKEYAQVAAQASPPCVLVMAKGAGAIPVTGEITEAKLLEALVTASRPSSCGPSGCGPSTPGCG